MKRLVFALSLLLAAGAAHAFDPVPARTRIGVLRCSGVSEHERESYAQRAVLDSLGNELRERGFDAYDAEATFDEVAQADVREADYYVEIVGGHAETIDHGGVGLGSRYADVSLGVIVSRVAAELRVYDGETMDVLYTETLKKKNTAVVPTSVGIGGRSFFAVFATPFLERAQVRSVARAAARVAADRVAEAVRQ